LNDDCCAWAGRAGPTFRLPADQAIRFLPADGWVVLQGVATLEVASPAAPQVVQLARAGDVVGGTRWLPDARAGALLRALTPCVLWRLPDPADDEARLRQTMQLLGQQAERAREMASLRTGGTVQRVRRLLALVEGPVPGSLEPPALRAAALPGIERLAAVVALPPAAVKRAVDRVLGVPARRAPAWAPDVRTPHLARERSLVVAPRPGAFKADLARLAAAH